MLISAMQEVFGTDDDLLAIEHAGYWGFDAIELITRTQPNGEHQPYTDTQIREIRDAIEVNGVMLSGICIGSSRDFGLVDYGEIGKGRIMRDFRDAILSAKELGSGVVLISFFGRNKIKNEDAQNRVIENICELVPIAEECRLILALEMTLSPEIMTDMIDKIGSQSVGIYYDVGNMTAGGFDNADAIRELGGYISAIHIKDRVIGNGGRRLGEGDVNFEDVRDALVEIGYDQVLTLETPIMDDPEIEARKNLAFVKGIWGM